MRVGFVRLLLLAATAVATRQEPLLPLSGASPALLQVDPADQQQQQRASDARLPPPQQQQQQQQQQQPDARQPAHRVGKLADVDGTEGDYTDEIVDSPPPLPPPIPSPPPEPAHYLEFGTMRIKLTGDDWVDAHNKALIDQVHLIHEYWVPLACAGVAFLLFLVHNAMLNIGVQQGGGCISEDARRVANVLSTAAAYMLCSFTNIIFNKLILRAIPLPAFVAAVQMGASCLTLLLVNGFIAALLHSRTSNVVTTAMWECLSYPCRSACGAETSAADAEPAAEPNPRAERKRSSVTHMAGSGFGSAAAAESGGSGGGGGGRRSTLDGAKAVLAEATAALSSAPLAGNSSSSEKPSMLGEVSSPMNPSSYIPWLCTPEASCGLKMCGMRRWKGERERPPRLLPPGLAPPSPPTTPAPRCCPLRPPPRPPLPLRAPPSASPLAPRLTRPLPRSSPLPPRRRHPHRHAPRPVEVDPRGHAALGCLPSAARGAAPHVGDQRDRVAAARAVADDARRALRPHQRRLPHLVHLHDRPRRCPPRRLPLLSVSSASDCLCCFLLA